MYNLNGKTKAVHDVEQNWRTVKLTSVLRLALQDQGNGKNNWV